MVSNLFRFQSTSSDRFLNEGDSEGLPKRYNEIYWLRLIGVTSHLSCVNQLLLNDLLGGRGWWLVKGALVRGPFSFISLYANLKIKTIKLLNFSSYICLNSFSWNITLQETAW